MFTRLRRLAVLLALADALTTQVALLAADFARRYLPLGLPILDVTTTLSPIVHLLAALVFPATFMALSVYNVRRDTKLVGNPFGLTYAVMVAILVFAGVLYFASREVSRLLVGYFFIIELGLLALIRLCLTLALRARRQQGHSLSTILLVGAGESAERLATSVKKLLEDSVKIVGCADDLATEGPLGLPILGQLADVPHLVQRLGVDDVILALPSEQYAAAEKLAFDLLTLPVRVRLVPDYLRLVVVQSSVESLGGVPLIGLREPRIDGLTWLVKRVFDVIASTLLALITWPFMLYIADAIRRDSPGPAIFKQQRVGENGKLFWMYKFRTMITNADMLQPEITFDANGSPIYKTPDDKRITRVGHFLRKTSLDELPQLWNVIKGEMSLVGPRPELQYIVERYEPWQRHRLAVPPGITGWWQVSGRSNLPMHLNTHLDLYYIRNYSLWLDIVILWKTVGAVFLGKGAY